MLKKKNLYTGPNQNGTGNRISELIYDRIWIRKNVNSRARYLKNKYS
jgi:hypothetical protein